VMTMLAVYAAACAYARVAGKTEVKAKIDKTSPAMAAESRQQRRARSRRTATTD